MASTQQHAALARTLDCVPSDNPSAALASWATAWLAGAVSHDAAIAAISGDDLHRVTGLPGEPAEATLGWALGRLRVAGACALRLVLPVPGDVVGLPRPADFRAAALDAGQAAVCVGADLALVPTVQRHESPYDGTATSVRWACHVVEPVPDCAESAEPDVTEADYLLRTLVRDAASALAGLDVARWRPELAGPLQDMRDAARRGHRIRELPPGYSARAGGLLVLADSIAAVVALAEQDDGAAVTSAQLRARSATLRELGNAARRARVAAYNSLSRPDVRVRTQ